MTKFYLITGFLGAGKTTFMKKFIQQFSRYRLHIIVNEFGKEGIDGQLLSELGTVVDEINNGSIFCACRLDKFEEVLQSALDQKPEIVIVEASGLSNPVNVRKVLDQPEKFKDLEYMGSICLVDARQFLKVYETATVVKKQIGISDIIILNKVDLATEESINKIKEIIRNHRMDIPIFETTYGEIQLGWLEQLQKPTLVEIQSRVQQKDITLRSYILDVGNVFQCQNFQKFIEMFIEDTYRIKGFVCLENRTYLLDCVGNLFKMTLYEGTPETLNQIVVLSGNGLPTKKRIEEAIGWYPKEAVKFVTTV